MENVLEVTGLKTYFKFDEGLVRAVDGVDFHIKAQQTLGIVGESGCGKSVTAQSIMRLLPRSAAIVDGSIRFQYPTGANRTEIVDLAQIDEESQTMLDIRGGKIAMIFQEPMTALSPVHTIGEQLIEAILLHQKITKRAARDLGIELLRKVGIPRAEQRIDDYAYQLSGGLRQRAMIAIALANRPVLLIADEPTTALDVTIQAQILRLIKELQQEYAMSVMIITHDLGVIARMANEVAVMYRGRVVEFADVHTIFHAPKHPYTKALLQSIPKIDAPRTERLTSIRGTVPEPFAMVPGCPFHPRCDLAIEGLCNTGAPPPLLKVGPNQQVACVLETEEVKAHV
ncbi:MAG: ABC transporter ATP-binding protein [Caldilineaceae bacterium]|nr:ABC transporter ATP-binding protein [Caldilineaceae bacterium]